MSSAERRIELDTARKYISMLNMLIYAYKPPYRPISSHVKGMWTELVGNLNNKTIVQADDIFRKEWEEWVYAVSPYGVKIDKYIPYQTYNFDMVDIVMYINLDNRKDRMYDMERELLRVGIPQHKLIRISAVRNTDCGALGCTCSHIKCLQLARKRGWNRVMILEDDFNFMLSIERLYRILSDIQRSISPPSPSPSIHPTVTDTNTATSAPNDSTPNNSTSNIVGVVVDSDDILDGKWDVILLTGNETSPYDMNVEDYLLTSRLKYSMSTRKFGYGKWLKRSFSTQTTAGYIVRKGYIPTLVDNFVEGKELLIRTGDKKKYSIDIYWQKLQRKDRWYIPATNYGTKNIDHVGYQRPSPSDVCLRLII